MPMLPDAKAILNMFRKTMDLHVLLVFADFIEEHGDERADEVRTRVYAIQNDISRWHMINANRLRRATAPQISDWIMDVFFWLKSTFKPGWKPDVKGKNKRLADNVADQIFKADHPEWVGRKIFNGPTRNDWQAIIRTGDRGA